MTLSEREAFMGSTVFIGDALKPDHLKLIDYSHVNVVVVDKSNDLNPCGHIGLRFL